MVQIELLTANCSKCQTTEIIKHIHIGIPIVLVLKCKHKVHITIPNMTIIIVTPFLPLYNRTRRERK